MKRIVLIGLLALAGCGERTHSMPDNAICTDYRVMVFYDNGIPPMSGAWTGPQEHVVCVVKEQKIANSDSH